MSELNDSPVTAPPVPMEGTQTEDIRVGTGEGDDVATPPRTDIPQPPDEIIAAAKLAPEHWLNAIDPHWSGEEPPPKWAVIGRWRTDKAGEIIEWEDNEEYRPSPEALGWPQPADSVDAAVQFAATGYGPEGAVVHTLAAAEVAVFLGPDGEPAKTTAPDGNPAVAVFTPATGLGEEDLPPYGSMPVAELSNRIPDGHNLLYLSPTAPVSMVIETAALRHVLALTSESAARGDQAADHGPGQTPMRT